MPSIALKEACSKNAHRLGSELWNPPNEIQSGERLWLANQADVYTSFAIDSQVSFYINSVWNLNLNTHSLINEAKRNFLGNNW